VTKHRPTAHIYGQVSNKGMVGLGCWLSLPYIYRDAVTRVKITKKVTRCHRGPCDLQEPERPQRLIHFYCTSKCEEERTLASVRSDEETFYGSFYNASFWMTTW